MRVENQVYAELKARKTRAGLKRYRHTIRPGQKHVANISVAVCDAYVTSSCRLAYTVPYCHRQC